MLNKKFSELTDVEKKAVRKVAYRFLFKDLMTGVTNTITLVLINILTVMAGKVFGVVDNLVTILTLLNSFCIVVKVSKELKQNREVFQEEVSKALENK